LLSPCKSLSDFDLWYHFIPSSHSNWSSLVFKQCFKSTSHGDNIVVSVFNSNCSIFLCNLLFSFLYARFIFLAHPLKDLHNDLILFCHLSIGVVPFASLCHIAVTTLLEKSLIVLAGNLFIMSAPNDTISMTQKINHLWWQLAWTDTKNKK
jgi:hypothetical protein